MTTDTHHEPQAESSIQGAKRMRYLHTARVLCGSSSCGFIDPITSTLAYQAPSSAPFPGHLITTLSTPQPPRKLPSPRGMNAGKHITMSPDGSWVTIFHPNDGQPGGVLGIYDSSILSPNTTSANVTAISSFNLPCSILAIHHNYPSRLYTSNGRGPSLGPKPPVTYDPSQGPSFTVLCSDGIYLFHPFQTLGTIPLDSVGSVPVNLTAESSQPTYRTQMLRCPLHTRFRAVMGGAMGQDTGLRARRGWLGGVAGSEAVWVGFEVMDGIRIVRVEYGLDHLSRFIMTTIPLPSFSLNRLTLTPSPKIEEGQDADEPKIELQCLVFVAKTLIGNKAKVEDDPDLQQKSDEPQEGVRAILVYSEEDEANTRNRRTCLSTLEVEKREVQFAESFKDIASDTVETSRTWDWIAMHKFEATTRSPPGWAVLALYPLPALSPSSLALALLQTPKGVNLSHIDLLNPGESDNEQWSALRGSSIAIRDDIDLLHLGLVVSQGVERGEQGLVAITNRDVGALLLVGPSLKSPGEIDGNKSTATDAGTAGDSIILAMKQESGYSDVIRAAFGSRPMLEREQLGDQILRLSYQKILDEDDLDELRSLFSLQVAIYNAMDDRRRETAAELIRLLDASHLFSRCAARGPNKKILFDLESVWSLISVADWVSGVLAAMMREIILERGRYEWCDPDDPDGAAPVRILYLLHPSLRALVLRLHTQLHSFINFVLSLDRPIPIPIPHTSQSQPGLMAMPMPMPLDSSWDPRATVLAKENVRDVLGKTGIDLLEWGKAIQTLAPGSSAGSDSVSAPLVSEDDYRTSLLGLSCDPLKPILRETLSTLPAPSSLFRSTSEFLETAYDAITLEPLSHEVLCVKCGRCGWKTSALGLGLGGGLNGMGMGRWAEWRKAFEKVCVCGGSWMRETKRHNMVHM